MNESIPVIGSFIPYQGSRLPAEMVHPQQEII